MDRMTLLSFFPTREANYQWLLLSLQLRNVLLKLQFQHNGMHLLEKKTNARLSRIFSLKQESLSRAISPLRFTQIKSYMLYLFPKVMSLKRYHRFLIYPKR